MSDTLAWQWSGTRWELRPPDQRPGLSGISAVAVVERERWTVNNVDPLWKWTFGVFEGGGYKTATHARWAVDGLIHKAKGGTSGKA